MGIRNEFKKQVSTYILASLGLVAGLAWNDAIKSLIEYFFPIGGSGGLTIKIVYAAILTIIVVLSSIFVSSKTEDH